MFHINSKLIVFLFFLFYGSICYAETYTVNTSVLNLRSCASTDCSIKAKLLLGETVEIENRYGSWAKISTVKGSGYVVSRSLIIKNEETSDDDNTNLIILITLVILILIGGIWRQIVITKKNRELIQTVTDLNRGTASELKLILVLLKLGCSPKSIFHDLYISKNDGSFSQIDLVMITKVGIIVFEVKDYSGWIYGSGKQAKWTKVLAYGREKYYFQNPIIQNRNHIEQLQKKIGEDIPFYSVIVFYGNCDLKDISFIPQNTFITKWYRIIDVLDTIFSKSSEIEFKDKDKITEILQEAVNNGNEAKTIKKHIYNISEMLGTNRIFK